MRRSLVAISTAVTSLVALAFLVPLSLLVGDVVRDRAIADAFRSASAVSPVLALTTDPHDVATALAGLPHPPGPVSVHLPATPAGDGPVVGAPAVGADVVRGARTGLATTVPIPHGRAVLQPVVLPGGRVAVVEVDVPEQALDRGVPRARMLLAALALVLVVGSVALADRLGTRVVRAAGRLRTGSARLGAGDLDVRLPAEGPPELREAARAFNVMAERVAGLLAAERERAADLSHRLRTPLAGLVLTGRSLGPGPAGDQVRAFTARLQEEVDEIIRQARGTAALAGGAAGGADAEADGAAADGAGAAAVPRGRCDAAAVVRDRLDFWGALAEDQNRPWRLAVEGADADRRVEAPVDGATLAETVDALLGNVFLHTPEGTAFRVDVARGRTVVEIAVSDDGPGIADPQGALRRGHSSAGSSGLGLDIAGRLARSCGGRLDLGRSATGGARVALVLPRGEPARTREP